MLLRPPLRALSQLLLVALGAGILVLAPTPRVVQAQEARTTTERLTLERRGTDRRSVHREVDGFEAVGVTLPSEPTEPVFVRGRIDDRWSPWIEAHFDATEAPDPGTEGTAAGAHSQPVWLGGATAYEVEGPANVATIDVHLVRERTVERKVTWDESRAEAATPLIRSRAQWGARAPKEPPSTTGDLKVAIVHHSVTANAYASGDVPALLRAIQAYHMDVNGWNDIAYNFAVDRFGQTWEARGGGIDRAVLGGHSRGFNTSTTGVVVLGDFTSATPPTVAVNAVANLIAWKFAVHSVVPSSTVRYTTLGSSKFPAGSVVTLPRIVGHRDVQATSCPGAQLHARLPTIRSQVASLMPGHQTGRMPDLLDLDGNGDGLTEALEYHPGVSGDQWWNPNLLGGLSRQAAQVSGTYRPFVGDFDGNGLDDTFWYGSGTAPDRLWFATLGGHRSTWVQVDGSLVPAVGDFDGNGADDILWYDAGPGPDRIWYHSVGGARVSRPANQDLVTGVPIVGRFNGDARDDIFWYGPGPSAGDALWLSTGRDWSRRTVTVDGRYRPVALDATGDGIDDIQWVASGTTTQRRWEFRGDGTYGSRALTAPVTGGTPTAGDFDGDGRDDLFLYAPGSGADALWYSNGTSVTAAGVQVDGRFSVSVGPRGPWGDATHDLLFVSNGADYLWRFGPGRTFSSTQVG